MRQQDEVDDEEGQRDALSTGTGDESDTRQQDEVDDEEEQQDVFSTGDESEVNCTQSLYLTQWLEYL